MKKNTDLPMLINMREFDKFYIHFKEYLSSVAFVWKHKKLRYNIANWSIYTTQTKKKMQPSPAGNIRNEAFTVISEEGFKSLIIHWNLRKTIRGKIISWQFWKLLSSSATSGPRAIVLTQYLYKELEDT